MGFTGFHVQSREFSSVLFSSFSRRKSLLGRERQTCLDDHVDSRLLRLTAAAASCSRRFTSAKIRRIKATV